MEDTPKKRYTKEKIITTAFVTLYASVFVGATLFVPSVFISIVQHDHPSYSTDEAQALASRYKSFLDGAVAFVNLFALPLLGGLSDVWGRRRVIIIGGIAQLLSIACLYAAYKFSTLWIIYVMSIFAFPMVIQLCALAYVGDISDDDEKEKTKNYGIIMAAFMLGIVIGGLGLGVVGNNHLERACLAMAGICIVMLLIVTCLFRENTTFYEERHTRKLNFKTINPIRTIRLMLGQNRFVLCMVIIFALNFIGVSDTMNTAVLYAQHRYNWGSMENGVSAAAKGVAGALWQGLGIGFLLKFFSQERILTVVLIASFFVYGLLGWAPTGWIYMVGGVIGGFASITFPMIQAIVSKHIPKDQQGTMLGGMSAISAVASLFGALMGGNVFSWCLETNAFSCPGTVFYVSGIAYGLDGIFCFILFKYFPAKTIPSLDTAKYSLLNIQKGEDEEEAVEEKEMTEM